MTGIYSSPVQYPTRPENAMLARDGLRPLCFDRPDFPPLVRVNSHAVHLRDASVLQQHTMVSNHMSKDCKSWSVHPAEDPATESVPGRESWRCWGCRHLPNDPRVTIRAAVSELP